MSDTLSYEDDYAYHLLMHGDTFTHFLNLWINHYPNEKTAAWHVVGDQLNAIYSFYVRWADDPRCMSEAQKVFNSLFEESEEQSWKHVIPYPISPWVPLWDKEVHDL
jgi:phosphoglycolate phosphatase-like HAD superfamily hydrolase